MGPDLFFAGSRGPDLSPCQPPISPITRLRWTAPRCPHSVQTALAEPLKPLVARRRSTCGPTLALLLPSASCVPISSRSRSDTASCTRSYAMGCGWVGVSWCNKVFHLTTVRRIPPLLTPAFLACPLAGLLPRVLPQGGVSISPAAN